MVSLPDVQNLNKFTPDQVQAQPQTSTPSYTPGLAAEGMVQGSTEVEKAVDNLQTLHNDAQARDRQNQLQDWATQQDIQLKTQYKGASALAAIPQMQADYGAKMQELSEGLAPDAALKFTTEAQSYRSFISRQQAEYGAQQYTASINQTADTTQKLAVQRIYNNPNDPTARADYIAGATLKEKNEGGDDAAQSARAQLASAEFDRQHGYAYLNTLPDKVGGLQKTLTGSGVPSSPFNLGNVKTSQGAADNTMDFVNPATPVDGVVLTANTLRNGYQGLTLAQIGAKWTGESPDKVANWVSNVSKASGIAPDATPNLSDPDSLTHLLSGIATAEKSGSDRKNFTPEVIGQGVTDALAGKPFNAAPPAAGTSVATGTPLDNIPVEERSKLLEQYSRQAKTEQEIQKSQYENAVDKFATDPKFTSMSQVPANITAGYASYPKMESYLEARASYNLKNSGNIVDADKLKYGSGFYNLLQNIYSPNGISKASDLYQYTGPGGILTIDGFDALKKEIDQKNSPQGQAIADAKSRLFDSGANTIYGESKSFGYSDPKGEALHEKWLALTLNDYQKGIQAGKTPTQLLNPESPDYIGKSVAMFTRSRDESMKDQLNTPRTLDTVESDIKYGRMTPEQAKPEIPALIHKEYAAGRMNKDQIKNALVKYGLMSQATPEATVPRPD